MSDTQQQPETQRQPEPEQPQAELRCRLAERIGYLAARHWLRASAPETGTTSNSEDAQRTVSYKGRRVDAADAESD